MIHRVRIFQLAALFGAEALACVTLVRLGRQPSFAIPVHDLGPWLRTTPPADALAAVLRVVALAGTAWLLLTTVAYLLARLVRVPGAVRAIRWTTLPAVRHVVDHALAVSVALGAVGAGVMSAGAPMLGAPVAYAADAPVPTASAGSATVRDGHAGALAALPAEPETTTAARPTARPTERTAAPPTLTGPAVPTALPTGVVPTTPTAGARPVVVAPGDNLWELAARELARSTGRTRADVPDSEIAPFWSVVCIENAPRLVSGDANLIYPGEVITFPAHR
jgi:hypothetical protein